MMSYRRWIALGAIVLLAGMVGVGAAVPVAAQGDEVDYEVEEYAVPAGSHPHDVAPAPDGTVWYTAQRQGALGRLDPATGETHHIPLGRGLSAARRDRRAGRRAVDHRQRPERHRAR